MAGKLTCVNIETTRASSVAGGSIVSADATWITSGSWQYRKMPDGSVHVRNPSGSPASITLPTGYRPNINLELPAVGSTNTLVPVTVNASTGQLQGTGELAAGTYLIFYGDQ